MNQQHKRISAGVDRVGSVFADGKRIYRNIQPTSAQFFIKLLADEKLMSELYTCGLIQTSLASSSPDGLVLEHAFVERQTFWNEWSFDMLKDAALLTIRLTARLLRSGLTLKDAHPYNVLFEGCRPVFVDFGSIVEDSAANRRSWERSFFSEFLLPLWGLRGGSAGINRLIFRLEDRPALKEFLGRLGFMMPLWGPRFRRTDTFTAALTDLEAWLIRFKDTEYATTWADYYERGTMPELSRPETYTAKERAAERFLKETRAAGCVTLLDLASNEGWFSKLGATLGYNVVALDSDKRAINNLYGKLGTGRLDISPVVMNFLHFTPAHGIGNLWRSATERLRSDTTLAMALIHHLALGQNLSFANFARQLAELTGRFAIVEFIDPSDLHIQRRARKAPWYTEEGFSSAMRLHFSELAQEVSEPATRKVFLYEKKASLG